MLKFLVNIQGILINCTFIIKNNDFIVLKIKASDYLPYSFYFRFM